MRSEFDADPSIIEPSSLSSPTSPNIIELSITEDANETSNQNMTHTRIMDSNTNIVGKWNASNYENDYKLLQTAMKRQAAIANLYEQRRKYTLDYGFARNRRPLFRDLLRITVMIGTLTMLLVSGNQRMSVSSGGAVVSRRSCDDITSLLQAWSWCQAHVLATKSVHTYPSYTIGSCVLHFHWYYWQ
jgi:hypothetical protein